MSLLFDGQRFKIRVRGIALYCAVIVASSAADDMLTDAPAPAARPMAGTEALPVRMLTLTVACDMQVPFCNSVSRSFNLVDKRAYRYGTTDLALT